RGRALGEGAPSTLRRSRAPPHPALSPKHEAVWRRGRTSFGAKQPIPRITQARHDITVIVEMAVDRGRVDRHIGMPGLQGFYALRRGDEADELDVLCATRLDAVERGDGGRTGREHRIA